MKQPQYGTTLAPAGAPVSDSAIESVREPYDAMGPIDAPNPPAARATLADAQPGGRVRLGDQALCTAELRRNAHVLVLQEMRTRFTDAGSPSRTAALDAAIAALSAQPSPGGQGDAQHVLVNAARLERVLVCAEGNHFDDCMADRTTTMARAIEQMREALAARQPVAATQPSGNSGELAVDTQPVGEPVGEPVGHIYQGSSRIPQAFLSKELPVGTLLYAAQPAQVVGLGPTFQAGVAEWMGQCFLPSLYSNMTERGDRLLEEVLELLQAQGYDSARVPTLVDYVFGRPVGEPAQEVGGVMVTLAGYCWVAGLDMHAAGDAELARIKQPDVMAKIRAKQEAKNALHFDTPLPGNAGAAAEEWPREGDLVRYDTGASALAIRLGPHAGGWHGYQCCGGYTFFTKAHKPTRADMDTWLDCAKYRDERTKVADSRVAHEMYLLDNQAVGNG